MSASPSAPKAARSRPSVLRRTLALLVCLAIGIALGWTGAILTGQTAWFLAVPVAVAFGWLFFADPSKCLPSDAPPEPRHTADGGPRSR